MSTLVDIRFDKSRWRTFTHFVKSHLIEIIVLTILIICTIEIVVNPSNTGTLEHFYTDHMREEWTAWCFLQLGFKEFYTPVKVIARECKSLHPHPFWAMNPVDRPLGCILVFLPFGILSNLGILPDVVVHKLEIFVITLQAVGAIYLVLKHIKNRFVKIMYLTFLSPYIIHWALNGIYDSAVLFFVILGLLAYERGRYRLSLLSLTYAIVLHYRAIMYAPLVLGSILKLVRRRGIKALFLGLVCIVAIVVCTIVPAYLTFVKAEKIFSKKSPARAVGFAGFKIHTAKLFLYYTGFGCAIAYLLYRRRIWHALSMLLGAWIIWTIFAQAWHAILIFLPWVVVDEYLFAGMLPIMFMFGVGSYLPWTLHWFFKNLGIPTLLKH